MYRIQKIALVLLLAGCNVDTTEKPAVEPTKPITTTPVCEKWATEQHVVGMTVMTIKVCKKWKE